MRAVAFVQARMGSQRLPGKALLPVWEEMPLLEMALRRVLAARSLDGVVLLTTEAQRDDQLVDVAGRLGVACFRGEEDDVLGRFVGALPRHPAQAIVRVCADNPFVDPRAIDDLVDFYVRMQPCDYASNHTAASGLPDGIGAEIMSASALERAARDATLPYDREHVTAYLLARPQALRLEFAPAPVPTWPRLKLDIDTAEDHQAMRELAARLPAAQAPLWDCSALVAAWEAPAGVV